MTPPEQARAARLTAIAREIIAACADHAQALPSMPLSENKLLLMTATSAISAHVETLTQQVAELRALPPYIRAEAVATQLKEMASAFSDVGRAAARDGKGRSSGRFGKRASVLREAADILIALARIEARMEQAEQARDAAHAALRKYGQHDRDTCSIARIGCGTCGCGLDAALAASAPQKEQK